MKGNVVVKVQKVRQAVRHINGNLLWALFLVVNTSFTLMTIGQTAIIVNTDGFIEEVGEVYSKDPLSDITYGVNFNRGWYSEYLSREKVSDPVELPMPSKARVDAWKKKYLTMPYPPKYKTKPSSGSGREVLMGVNHHYSMLHECDSLLEYAYIEYTRYGLDVTPIINVCNAMRKVSQINAWKKVWEHTTKVKEAANETLRQEIRVVRRDTDALFKKLVEIKRDEYANWANNHPQQAMNITVKKRLSAAEQRVQNAERRARNAERRARNAEAEAASAAGEAAEARRDAANAANAARAAERRAYDAENRLR